MSICYIDQKKFNIEIVDSPMVSNWLKIYNGVTFKLSKPFDKKIVDQDDIILSEYQNFFKKLQINLEYEDKTDLYSLKVLSKIHVEIVNFQKKFQKGTNFINENTNENWDLLHDLLHNLESQIKTGVIEFRTNDAKVTHDHAGLTENWSWEPKLSKDEFHASASFSRSHINIPTAELGRLPYECFLYSPDTWLNEGSIHGQIGNSLHLQMNKTSPRPDKGYEEWCQTQKIPVIGNNFPLANFTDNFAIQLVEAKEIIIEK